jgi:hypothetical protein
MSYTPTYKRPVGELDEIRQGKNAKTNITKHFKTLHRFHSYTHSSRDTLNIFIKFTIPHVRRYVHKSFMANTKLKAKANIDTSFGAKKRK